MPLVVVTQPAWEPVSLDEAKLHLRVDTTDDDELIASLITAAREACEDITGRALATQTLELQLDAWNADPWLFPRGGYATQRIIGGYSPPILTTNPNPIPAALYAGAGFVLPKPPVQAVAAITTIDTAGASATIDPAVYAVDTASEPARVALRSGQVWPPALLASFSGVRIRYTAGYANQSKVPASLKAWMKLQVGALYENREQISVGSSRGVIVDVGGWSDRLLNRWRVAALA